MSRAGVSGFRLTDEDITIVLGMLARGDRRHDIAAWFGVNQGRIKGAEDGQYGTPPIAPAHELPPKGAPGVKGLRLHDAVTATLDLLKTKGDVSEAIGRLEQALGEYNAHEA